MLLGWEIRFLCDKKFGHLVEIIFPTLNYPHSTFLVGGRPLQGIFFVRFSVFELVSHFHYVRETSRIVER